MSLFFRPYPAALVFLIVALAAAGPVFENRLLEEDTAFLFALRTELISFDGGDLICLPDQLTRPIPPIFLSFAAHFWKSNPIGYRLTSFFLHLLAGWTFYLLLRKWHLPARISFPAAVIFLLHPLNTAILESLRATGELTGAVFAFLTLITLTGFYQSRPARYRRLGFAGGFLILSLLSSRTFIFLPFFTLILIGYPAVAPTDQKTGLKKPLLAGAVFFLTALIYLTAISLLTEAGVSYPPAFRGYLRGIPISLRLLFLPWGLSVYHPPLPLTGDGSILAAVGLMSVVFVLLVFRKNKFFPLFISGSWVLIALFASFLLSPRVDESSLYFPAAGFALFLSLLFNKIIPGEKPPPV